VNKTIILMYSYRNSVEQSLVWKLQDDSKRWTQFGPEVWDCKSACLAHSHAAASVVSKMAPMQHKISCVRELIKTESEPAMGVCKRSSLCTTSTNNFGWPKNCITTLVNSVTQHPSLGMGWIQLACWCYPCGRKGAHWTSVNIIVSIIKYTLHHICH
jgi:hypothetical protein